MPVHLVGEHIMVRVDIAFDVMRTIFIGERFPDFGIWRASTSTSKSTKMKVETTKSVVVDRLKGG